MSVFQFKQFSVLQEGASMKINTDGVLLAAICDTSLTVTKVLDIGTGTGVLALMLAQKFEKAVISAIDIDAKTVLLAKENAENAIFRDRLKVFQMDILDFYTVEKFEVILSNPPFFIDSLKNPDHRKKEARHTNLDFFAKLFLKVKNILAPNGEFWFIVPFKLLEELLIFIKESGLYIAKIVQVYNHLGGKLIRKIVVLSHKTVLIEMETIYIRDEHQQYSSEYKKLIAPYFL